MLAAFGRAIGQFGDPYFRRPLYWSLGLTVLVFAALWTVLWLVVMRTALFETVWLDRAVDALGGLAVIALTVILFPVVAAAVLSLFLDAVIAAVEARHYPDLPPPRPQNLGEAVLGALRFAAVAVGLNLLCLPLYLVPGLNLVVFYALNGYLLGREYFEIVTPRRLPPAEAQMLWRRRRWTVVAAGVVVAFGSIVPIVNFVVPMVAVAAMTHLVEGWRRDMPGGRGEMT